MDKQIEELHSALLKIVKEVHRICVDNDIKYFMMAGTMLGAVRHKGFMITLRGLLMFSKK